MEGWSAAKASLFLVLTIGICGAVSVARAESTAPSSSGIPAPPLFQRIVLLGASGTSGFDKSEPLGGPKSLQFRFAPFVEAVSTGARTPVATIATHLFFLNPEPTMESQVAATLAAKPSLVIGLDALFWACYGTGLKAPERLTRFETGLRQLERIDAPLVVADIPDASPAVGLILNGAQVPAPWVIAKCNQRLKEWAATHPRVVIFPLASLMSAAHANRELSIAGLKWPAGETSTLLRPDRLHPSQRGLAALAIALLDTAANAFAPESAGSLNHDLEAVFVSSTQSSRKRDNTSPESQ